MDLFVVPMLEFLRHSTMFSEMVLLGKDLLVMYRLYRGVMMVLANFTVNSSGGVLVLMRLHGLMGHGRVDAFMNGSVMLAALVKEFVDLALCLVHDGYF